MNEEDASINTFKKRVKKAIIEFNETK